MMNGKSDTMVAYPPWKLEYLEKKRKKEVKVNEVPQWKRELLKRIQSKNLRMIEEQQQQADILEEHIPKVSDNIFVTHEKKPQRLPSVPILRTLSSEQLIVPSPTFTIAVDNIIIIEKPDKEEVRQTGDSESPSTGNEQKEYPKAGLVNRLLGRFQTDNSEPQTKTSSPAYSSYQKPKVGTDTNKKSKVPTETRSSFQALTPPDSPDPISLKGASPQPLDLTEKSEPQGENTMQSDMLSPLLISSAKPFSRQFTSDKGDGFHHVKMPIRKVTAPSGVKNVVPKSETNTSSKVDAIPCPPEFADDLSNLHANATEIEKTDPVKETLVIKPDPMPQIQIPPTRVNLKNGGTLHSSGTDQPKSNVSIERKKPPVPSKRFDTSNLQDKRNLVSRPFFPREKPKSPEKSVPEHPKVTKKVTLETEATVKTPSQPIEQKSSDQPLTDNQLYTRPARKRSDHDENQYKKVVHESFDEETLKSSAAKAANRIMQSSKTFKITPSKQAQRNTIDSSTKPETALMKLQTESAIPKSSSESYRFSLKSSEISVKSKQPPKIPARRHEIESPDPVPATPVTKVDSAVLPKLSVGKSNLTSDAINDNKVDLSNKSAPAVLPTSVKQKDVSLPVKQPTKSHQSEVSKSSNLPTKNVANSTVTPPFKSESKQSLFGPRKTKSSATSRGKSFTIDPSKFKRSSAQPPSVTTTSGNYQDNTSTRTIVPGAKSQINPDSEFGGDQPKSGKRKLTVDQITVIGGYVTLEKSCLTKDTKRKKSVTISFPEKDLETTYSYVSERSLLEEDKPSVDSKVLKSPGFAKDSTIGKYTPKYLLSLKNSDILDNEDDNSDSKSAKNSNSSTPPTTNHATPLSDDNAIAWSDTTSGATDILF